MSTPAARVARKNSLAEQMIDVKRRFMQLFKAFEAMSAQTDEEMQARPTKTEVAQMIGHAIEQALGQRVVHNQVTTDEPTTERALALVTDDSPAEQAATFVADDEGEGPE